MIVSMERDPSGAAAQVFGGGSIMMTPQIHRSGTRKGRRGIVLFVAGAIALGLGVTGVYSALAGGSSSLRRQPGSTATFTLPRPTAPAAVTRPVPVVTPSQPTSDPTALADGVYPTYVRSVDVQSATITVDVLQVFTGSAAHRAAIEDGVPWTNVRYDPVYIRNENPLLRTLPVARDVHIELFGECTAPNRWAGLTELRKATRSFTDMFYYEISVVGGRLERIGQLVAIAAC
jgi:hypothetical protein